MFRLLRDIFRHKFQDLLYILFYRFYVLQFFCRTIALEIPFCIKKTRVNVYMVLGRGVVGSCFWVSTIVRSLFKLSKHVAK